MPRMLLFFTLLQLVPATALAWSSLVGPLFDTIHQAAIDHALPALSEADRKVLKDQQKVIDTRQSTADSYQHAMMGMSGPPSGVEALRKRFRDLTDGCIHQSLVAAQQSERNGDHTGALQALGAAIHAMEDATSPTHDGFQPWRDDESIWEKAKHVAHERVYPDDSGPSSRKVRLEASVAYAYDLFIGRVAQPATFFDTSFRLVIPQSYLSR